MKTLFLILLFLPIINQAQVSPNISKRYPAHVVYKIDEVISKVNLSEDKQIKIAKKFIKTDSIVSVGLASGAPANQLKNYYTIDKKFLKDIVSVEELERYSFESDKDNRFLATLINASLLKLQSSQISKIRQLNDSLDTTIRGALKETLQFQNLKLSKILSQQQYLEVLKFTYKDESLADAKKDWERILSLKINTSGKEKEEYQQIVDFHSSKNGYLDNKAELFEIKKQDFLSLKAALMEPPLLIRAKILSDQKHANNKYASLIEFEKELNLTKNQIDTLLTKYLVFERIKIENKENDLNESLILPKPLPPEFEDIIKIVTTEQFSKWLTLKHKKEAIKKANQSWAKLELEGLTKNKDKKELMPQLTLYHLKLLIAVEKNKNFKTSENRFLIRDVEQKKPEILLQLDAINRSKTKNENTKNALAW